MAKAKPGALTFGSMGNGSGAHLAAELFKSALRAFRTRCGLQQLPRSSPPTDAGQAC
jgi:tripartite-type tricarboxylate transporter receptor subunit TctC